MITRTMDAAFLNEVANEPDIRPWLGGEGEIDLAPALANPDNLAFIGKGGGWFFAKLALGAYEAHSIFRKEGRGRSYLSGSREVLRYMFTRTDALEILTKCPDENNGARMAGALLGFRERFRREKAWPSGCGISYRAFTLDDWMARDEEALRAGREFHAALEAAKAARGSALEAHEEDEAHDRAVGAAVLMSRGGNPGKAVGFYNRWAGFAGYASIGLVGEGLVDIQEAIVDVQRSPPEVLLLR